MTELEKMQRAKMYIDKLANGINPIDDAAAPENDVINNVRLSRCFFYVSDILRQVIENGGTAKAIKSAPKSPFFLTDEQKNQYIPSDKPISVSEITKALNAIADLEKCKKLFLLLFHFFVNHIHRIVYHFVPLCLVFVKALNCLKKIAAVLTFPSFNDIV